MCGCLLGLLALITPRLVLVILWLMTDYLSRAFDTFLWPFLGFLFMPLTTLAAAWSMNTYGGVRGLGLVAVVLGVLIDLGIVGGGESARRRRRVA